MKLSLYSDETNTDSQDAALSDENLPMSEAQVSLNAFWPQITDEIKRIKTVDAKNQVLPLARIKKIMKLDEDVKMISAEAPLLFAKAAEIFIHELTLRAWVHTEDNKRRTLQRNDIAMAITKFDQFDFLIDIVPREEAKPTMKKENEPAKPAVNNCDQVQYYLQLAQQHQQALQGTTQQQHQQQQPQQTIQMQSMSTPVTLSAPHQNILVTNNMQQTHQQQPQQIQLVQQIVTPNGEITHVPVRIFHTLKSFSFYNLLPHFTDKLTTESTEHDSNASAKSRKSATNYHSDDANAGPTNIASWPITTAGWCIYKYHTTFDGRLASWC